MVGDFYDDKNKYIKEIKNLKIKKNVDIYDQYVPDREVEKYFAASDLVVLPYRSATQSAIAQIVYDFNKPLLVTDVGGLPEVVIDNRTGYVVPPRNPFRLAEKIIEYYKKNRENIFVENIENDRDKFPGIKW